MDEIRLTKDYLNKEIVPSRMNYWKKLMGGNEQHFQECIGFVMSMTKKEVLQLTSPSEPNTAGHQYIDWADQFISLHNESPLDSKIYQQAISTIDIPYHPFIEPYIRLGWNKLLRHLDTLSIKLPNENVINEVLSDLVKKINQLSYRMLILELNIARESGQLYGETSEERFDYFVQTILNSEEYRNNLANEYPVLIRSIVQTIENWTVYITDIFERVETDKQLLQSMFHDGKEIGQLVKLNLNAGDAHNKGQGVAILEFENAVTIVYKPRSLQVDLKYMNVLNWINHIQSEKEPLYVTKIIDRKTYGYSEFIQYKPCCSNGELSTFFTQVGNQLALLYILNSVDFHFENIIAHGPNPVLIDLESILHQTYPRTDETKTAFNNAINLLERSVLSTGMLPSNIYYRENPNKKGVNVGGLSQASEQTTPFKVNQIAERNTDSMRIIKDYTVLKAEKNRPTLNGENIEITQYLDAIIQGFKQVYSIILNNKESFKKELQAFKGVHVRSILRATSRYSALLRSSYHPDLLRYGLDREFLLHRLWVDTDLQPQLKKLVDSEVKDLLGGDIPYFMTKPESRHLWDSRGTCNLNFFERSSYDIVVQKLNDLCEEDCAQQIKTIHMSMLANNAQHDADVIPINIDTNNSQNLVKCEDFLKMSEEIGEYIQGSSIKGINDGEEDICWISTVLEGNSEIIWDVSPIGEDLYNGLSGISLYFGYLGELTGRQDFKETAKKALVPLRKSMKSFRDNPAWSIGAFSGTSGYLYTASHLASLWNDNSLKQEILSCIPAFTDMIKEDKIYDFIGGSAGALKIMLGLYYNTKEPLFLNAAIRCGDHLISHSYPIKEGMGWKAPWEEMPLTGFSHGVAGIVAVLSELYLITRNHNLKDAIHRGLLFERQYYSAEHENWLTPNRDKVTVAWCHGAPGILLSRLMLKKAKYEDEFLDHEIEIALKTTIRLGFGNNRSLCHGDFGQIEILKIAADILNRKELDFLSHSVASQVFRDIEYRGWKNGVSRGTETIGLMVGLAGYGMGLLKQAHPKSVPSILTLEEPIYSYVKN
jgi:type 2 lantibiotic biosynthesis protein LanM